MTLGDIKAALQTYAARSDAATGIATYLPVVEQRIYYGEVDTPALRISAMLKSGTDYALPADWLEMKRVTAGGPALDFSSFEEFAVLAPRSGVPGFYNIQGRTLAIAPTSLGQTVAYSYYARFPALDAASDASTNWLTANAPSVYIAGLLIELARATQDDDMLVKETQNYKSALAALMGQDQAAQMSGATLRRRSGMAGGRR